MRSFRGMEEDNGAAVTEEKMRKRREARLPIDGEEQWNDKLLVGHSPE